MVDNYNLESPTKTNNCDLETGARGQTDSLKKTWRNSEPDTLLRSRNVQTSQVLDMGQDSLVRSAFKLNDAIKAKMNEIDSPGLDTVIL